MEYGFTDPQVQRLREFGEDAKKDIMFDSEAERDKAFSKTIAKLSSDNEKGIKAMIAEPDTNRLIEMQRRIADALKAEGFIEVVTPLFTSKAALYKMSITEDHPLYQQMFQIDSKRFLRPMLAPNLYYVMRKLRDHTDGPIKIFEVGSCFRAESHGNDHLEEFTMLNLVDMGPQGDTIEKIKHYISVVMDAVGLDYKLVEEESDVYKKTIDVEVNGEEVCSAAVGPMYLDPAFDVHEPWCGAGFGIERLIMMKYGEASVKKVGRSLGYVNGFKIN